MFQQPSDLPFEEDGSPYLLPWILAVMVYLAILFLVGSIVLDSVIVNWNSNVRNGFTIELSPPESDDATSLSYEFKRQKLILDLLSNVPNIKKTEVISKSSFSSITDSLFTNEEEKNMYPVPTTIDVEVYDINKVDLDGIERKLSRLVPGITVKSDREWRKGFLSIATTVLGISVVIAVLIAFITIIISVFTTHTGLIIHKKIIEILRLVGAHNSYIANQFQNHALKLGLLGGVMGLLFYILSFLGIIFLMHQFELPDFTKALPYKFMWITAISFPFIVIVLMAISARITVLWELRKIP